MNIQDFAARFTDLSRDNRFKIGGPGVPQGDLIELIQTVSLPGIQVHTGIWRNVGHGLKYPNNVLYNELTLTFYDTPDNKIQQYYTDWIDEIYFVDSFEYKDQYVRDFQITKLNRENEEGLTYNIVNAFPINISDVNLSNASQNTLTSVTVTYSYDNWTMG